MVGGSASGPGSCGRGRIRESRCVPVEMCRGGRGNGLVESDHRRGGSSRLEERGDGLQRTAARGAETAAVGSVSQALGATHAGILACAKDADHTGGAMCVFTI